jgi:hypothetical protein
MIQSGFEVYGEDNKLMSGHATFVVPMSSLRAHRRNTGIYGDYFFNISFEITIF